jgi:peptide/nickel transport system ATP-binding protein
MYAGRFVESGSIQDIMDRPSHPYTQGLLRSTVHGGDRDRDLEPIPGAPPDLADLPPGCCFAPRCHLRQPACDSAVPPLAERGAGHGARCIFTPAQWAEPARGMETAFQ